MAVRPFYMTADIDGRNTELTGGPRAKYGSQRIEIKQRNQGEIETAFTIYSTTIKTSTSHYLVTQVKDINGMVVAEHRTEY